VKVKIILISILVAMLFLSSCFSSPSSQKLYSKHYHGGVVAIYYEYGSASTKVLHTNIFFEDGKTTRVNGFWSLRIGSMYSFSLDSDGNIISIGFSDNEKPIQ
jgi:hypothetical protein